MADEPTPDQPTDAQDPAATEPQTRDDEPVAGRFANPEFVNELGANEANQQQPLRGRPVENDVRPLSTHRVLVDPQTGVRSRVVEEYHKPGAELPPPDPHPTPEFVQEREDLDVTEDIRAEVRAAAEERAEPLDPVPTSPVTTDADATYASKDNIVRP